VRRAPGARLAYLAQEVDWDEGQSGWQAALSGLQYTNDLERELRTEEALLARGEGSLERYAELQDLFDRAGGYAAEAGLREILAALGLAEERLLALPVGRLSGGERSRLALARALAADPEVLLLDEPSNHLDLHARQWLGQRLRRLRGALLLVSHDRALLDEVCTDTAELRSGELVIYRGGISKLRERQGVLRRSSERQQLERRKEMERLERTAAELRAWGTAKAQRRRKRVERDLEELSAGPVGAPDAPGPSWEKRPFLASREASGVLLEARRLRKSLGELPVIREADLRLEAGDKVALVGPNGSGKSTLLRLLAGELASDDPGSETRLHRDAKLLYLDQHGRGLDAARPLLEQLGDLVSSERAHLLLSLAGLDEERRFATPPQLSGGERARAGLARLLAAQANVILLDEPTNDLDLEAVETLHGALETTEAAVVMATHDRALARLAERVWAIEEGVLVEYRGGLDGYLAGRRRLERRAGRPGGEAGPWSAAPSAATPEGAGQAGAPTAGPGEDPGDQSGLERLELQRIGIEGRLDGPLLLAERERERLEKRLALVIDELSLRYDRPLPPPRPAFSVREGVVTLMADLAEDGLLFQSTAPAELRLLLRDGVGHLTLREREGSCLLPWARAALLDGATRLAFYALAPKAVQHYSRADVEPRLLQPAGGGWWALSRARFEAREGWFRPAPARSRRAGAVEARKAAEP
jgi:ATPase subunit of ABC transporter with duplicated ATPase domains